MILLMIQGVFALLILIAAYIITISPESDPYMIYIMSVMAGTWLTKWIEDLKEWRRTKKMSGVIGTCEVRPNELIDCLSCDKVNSEECAQSKPGTCPKFSEKTFGILKFGFTDKGAGRVILFDDFSGAVTTVFTNQLKHVKLND